MENCILVIQAVHTLMMCVLFSQGDEIALVKLVFLSYVS